VVRCGGRRMSQRATKQRTAIAELLAAGSQFQSAQEIFAQLRTSAAPVGLTTVYRSLQGLVDAGEVDAIRRHDGEMVYRRCAGTAHHHHLVCRTCGRTVEVEGPDVERWAHDVASTNGFTDVSHVVEIFGVCSTCQL
jgi:Fur family transcriptional regulator, ferric uptake regulator